MALQFPLASIYQYQYQHQYQHQYRHQHRCRVTPRRGVIAASVLLWLSHRFMAGAPFAATSQRTSARNQRAWFWREKTDGARPIAAAAAAAAGRRGHAAGVWHSIADRVDVLGVPGTVENVERAAEDANPQRQRTVGDPRPRRVARRPTDGEAAVRAPWTGLQYVQHR